ncbi:MAG TPA: serine/threonine-protein kinase [Polyangiaceae bacterium]|jgi:serine/threonine-protein kinase
MQASPKGIAPTTVPDALGSPNDVPAVGACIAARYVVEELIAEGGMSVVVRARDLRLGHAVALKVMRRSRGIGDAQIARFLREAQTVARLRSEHVVRVLDVDTLSHPPFLAMELVEGGDVSALMRERGPCSVQEALEIVIQACRGVALAHAIGVVHRDLKPSNLLLAKTAGGGLRVKVTDFGISKMVVPDGAPDLTSSGQILGSPRYMSPEQVRGASTVDARADVWALGVLLYELIVGAAPFDALTVADTLARIVAEPSPPLRARAPAVPPELEAIVAMCLEKDAALRPPSVSALLEELEAIAASGRVRTPGEAGRAPVTDAPARIAPPGGSGLESARRRPWRRPLGAALAGLVAVAACAGLGLRWGEPRGTSRAAPAPPASAGAPTTLLTLPAPQSDSPDALAAFADGMRALHDGGWSRARQAFARAVAADPMFAAAHLRLGITSSGSLGTAYQTRLELQRAAELRARLGERDRALLEGLEPMLQRTPSDHAEARARLREATERYPNDAELHLWLGVSSFETTGIGDPALALPSFARASALDPGFADAWEAQGKTLAWLGRVAEARDVFEQCLTIPTAVDCLYWLKFVDAAAGECATCERDARRRIDRDPLGTVGPRNLADAFLALGRPSEGVHTALVQSWRLWDDQDRPREELADEADFAVVEGDFTKAHDLARRQLALVESDPEGQRHFRPTKTLVKIALETGDLKTAGALADAFVRRAGAWATTERSFDNDLPWLLHVARRDGTLSSADFEAARRAWASTWRGARTSAGYVWVLAYADAVDSPEEAREALALLPEFGALPPFFPIAANQELPVGKVFALAGRSEEAKVHLVRGAKHCARLEDPFAHPQAELELGLLEEANGNADAACAAYQAVLSQWGSAKPRSVTAERARERARPLRCTGPRGAH